MGKAAPKSVDQYIATQPETARASLERIRAAIRRALPDADETISYGMPAYKRNGSAVIYFAGWKEHYSLYPASATLIEAFKDELTDYEINKSTIRFPFRSPVPEQLIQRIAAFRMKEVVKSD